MVKMMGMKCGHCGSTNVGADLASSWDNAAQGWDAVGDLDGRVCHDCGADPCNVVEYELRGQELADAMHARRLAGVEDFIARLREQFNECGAVGNLVLPEVIEQATAIRNRLYQFAATLAQQDELIDALALTIPYAETRAEDLDAAAAEAAEDDESPGHAEAASVIHYANRVLTQHGGKSYLLERGQRAGVQP